MNMFARFNENPAMTLQDIKETKCYGRTHGQRENSIPTTNKICVEYKNFTDRQTLLQKAKAIYPYILRTRGIMSDRRDWKR